MRIDDGIGPDVLDVGAVSWDVAIRADNLPEDTDRDDVADQSVRTHSVNVFTYFIFFRPNPISLPVRFFFPFFGATYVRDISTRDTPCYHIFRSMLCILF